MPTYTREELELMAKNGHWKGIIDHFLRIAPTQSYELELLAVAKLSLGSPDDYIEAELLLHRAVKLEPRRLSVFLNLIQLNIDRSRLNVALELLESCLPLFPNQPELTMKHFLALHAASQWEEAWALLPKLLAIGKPDLISTQNISSALLAEVRSRWWRPRKLGTTIIRLPLEQDLAHMVALLSNEDFRQAYNLQTDARPAAVARGIFRARQSPLKIRRLDWVVCQAVDQTSLQGLVSLVDIDWQHRRAELVVGFEPNARSLLPAQATTMAINYAFTELGIEKICSYVYDFNVRGWKSTLHLGFRPEGLLRGHLRKDKKRIDINVASMLSDDFQRYLCERNFYSRWLKNIEIL